MNSKVDVLAVMHEAAVAMALEVHAPDRPKHTFVSTEGAADMREARAAVAELIETQRELLLEIERARSFETDIMQRVPCDTLARANIALARVTGA